MSKAVLPDLDSVFKALSAKKEAYIKDLTEYVEVPSKSADVRNWKDVRDVMMRYHKRLEALGTTLEVLRTGQGEPEPPPVILGTLGEDPGKKTILLYFHLDVHIVKENLWTSDPFTVTERGGKLYGRGVTLTKGPALVWLHVLELYKELGHSLPVNFKIVLEGMYELCSRGLEEACLTKKSFFSKVDVVCVCNSTWLDEKRPCVAYGHRGLCYFEVRVRGMSGDLHSGDYGGVVCEPMSDLVTVLGALLDRNNKITIPGVLDGVLAPTEQEMKRYEGVNLDVGEMRTRIGAASLLHAEKPARLLAHQWRLPSLSLHGVEGADAGDWEKTVIPSRVIGKFSIRIVENQTPAHVSHCVTEYIEKLWREMESVNTLEVKMTGSSRPFVQDPDLPVFKTALEAVKLAFRQDGLLIRDGATIPPLWILHHLTEGPVVILCVVSADSAVQCPNERVDIGQLMDAHKLAAAFMHEVARTL